MARRSMLMGLLVALAYAAVPIDAAESALYQGKMITLIGQGDRRLPALQTDCRRRQLAAAVVWQAAAIFVEGKAVRKLYGLIAALCWLSGG